MKDIIEKHMRITIEEALIARAEGENQKNIVGNILLEEGLKVFDKYFFVPQERPSQKLCKPPKWCKIGAPNWRYYYEQQKEQKP